MRIPYGPTIPVLALLFAAVIYTEYFGTPHIRPASLSDFSLQFPQRPSIVPNWELILGSFVLPTAIITLATLPSFCMQSLVSAALATLEANLVTWLLTNVAKLAVGRPRPFFASVCKSYNPPDSFHCTGDAEAVAGARVSFPSGHSALSFSAAVLTSLMLIRLFRQGKIEVNSTIFAVIAALPVCLSGFVAVSRLIDYHHHFADVVGGAFLGTLIACLVFAVRFGSVEPASSRGPGNNGAAASDYGAV